MTEALDRGHMAAALRLAQRGIYTSHPNPRVGCLIVRDAVVVGEGWHERTGGPHAEVMALAQAGEQARGATAYVTLEPCCHHGRTPPCTQALIKAGIQRVVVAMTDPNPLVAGQGVAELQAAGIQVETGLMAADAEGLNRGFKSRMQRQRPWVTLKLAMSLDGRTAAADGSSQWITGPAARADSHRLRAHAGAVLTGIGTVLADDPRLNVRLDEADGWNPPHRLVLDSQLRMPANAAMLSLPGRTTVFTITDRQQAHASLEQAGAEVVVVAAENGRPALAEVLTWLAKHEINEVLVEAGSLLSGAFVAANLVDELVIYMAPTLLGNEARGLLSIPGLNNITEQRQLRIISCRAIGNDWRLTACLES